MADNQDKKGLLNSHPGTESPAGLAKPFWELMIGSHEGQHGHEPTAEEIAARLQTIKGKKGMDDPLTLGDQEFLERHTLGL